MKIIIKNAKIITMDNDRVIDNGTIAVKDEKITFVGENTPSDEADKTIDARGRIVIPGLINTHAHSPMHLFRGYADDMKLEDWLFKKIFPMEDKLNTQLAYIGTKLACAEMIRSGTTTFSDMYFFNEGIIKAAVESKMNANISRCVTGIEKSEYMPRLNEAKKLYSEFNGKDNIIIEYSAHAVYTCSKECLRAVSEAAGTDNARIHIHLSETLTENKNCLEANNQTPAQVFDECNIFDSPTNAAHCVHLSESDMDILKAKNVSVAHNPVSNLKLASGICELDRLMKKGINIGIGTDGAASNNSVDMLSDMKLAALLQKGSMLDPTVVTARAVLEMATANGAKALARADKCGKIKEGMNADIVILDDSPNMLPVYDPVSAVVYSANGNNVDTVLINGETVLENKEFKTIDIEKLRYELDKAVKYLRG